MQKLLFSVLATLLVALGCNSPKAIMQADEMEVRQLDTLVITPSPDDYIVEDDYDPEEKFELPVYRSAYERTHDLLHTQLKLRFDWEKEQVIGQATLDMTPLAYPSSEVRLDAKGFDFKVIKLANSSTALDYRYEGDKQEVFIQLDRTYKPGEKFQLYFDYIATPEASGGSQAITSDQGLFFINPRGEEVGKPRQIWTQGETEHNSRWFPTIDKPNERCTQEMFLTVADNYETLSNGVLVSSEKNDDGTRTDYWKMDMPHAPYLFMIAVGEFAVVEDEEWNGIPVNYYVEEEYAPYAADIFPHTPEMLTFFSELTGVKYPWPKYSQVVVRDYVSGAMENTTGVIFGDFMYGDDRELMDAEINQKIVAHEMFHHWFGDLVTCESWSNLTLNEGFANYSEYLWMEKKHGRDAADAHLLDEWGGYLGSIQGGGEPHELIWMDYDDKEQMFDGHSYNKGGAVLHMIRNYLGDEVFFTALKNYLTTHQFTAVEVDELRMAFEDASGQDLKWFFNQWYHKAGHPRLELSYDYSAEAGEAYVNVKQIQTTRYNVPPIFQLPVAIDIYTNGAKNPERHLVMINEREQQLSFPVSTKPDVIIFDAEHQLLAEIDQDLSVDELIAQFNLGPRFLDRMLPLQRLASMDDPRIEGVMQRALQDPFHAIRLAAMEALGAPTAATLPIIRQLAESDPNSEVRSGAILTLAAAEDEQAAMLAKAALDAKSYMVVGAGLQTLAATDMDMAVAAAKELEDSNSGELIGSIAAIYGEVGDPSNLGFFEEKINEIDGFPSLSFFGTYLMLLLEADETTRMSGLDRIKAFATQPKQAPWRRIAAFKAYSDAIQALSQNPDASTEGSPLNKRVMEMGNTLRAVRDAEPEGQIKGIFQQIFPG